MHIFSAPMQEATSFVVPGLEEHGPVVFSPMRRLWTWCCDQRRIARNLQVQAYYDGTRFYCKNGTGCKAGRAKRTAKGRKR